MRLPTSFLLALAIVPVTVPAAAQTAGSAEGGASLDVTFQGLETKDGAVMVALFDEAGWASGRAVRSDRVSASAAGVTASFAGLPPGRYGVKAFHDVDGDGRLDTNMFGMPTEPYAFSRDARGQGGPAAWTDVVFEVTIGANVQRISIR